MKHQKLFSFFFLMPLVFVSTQATGQVVNRNIHEKYVRDYSLTKMLNSLFERKKFNKSYALIIGLSDYSGGWAQLEAPFHDALRVKDFLINQAQFDVVITLTNKEASSANITKYMEEIFPKLISERDRFIFYFSGHGTQRNIGNRVRGYVPMLNSDKDSWSDMISMDDIERWNENMQEAKHALFALDCCFSGLAGNQKKTSAKSYIFTI